MHEPNFCVGGCGINFRDVAQGRRSLIADTPLRLGLYFSIEPRFWLNLQSEYDMRVTTRNLQDHIAQRIRVFRAAETPENAHS
jgi:antitoxin HigA-1